MRTVTPQQARRIAAQPHRPGGVSFEHLLAGDDGAPDNYSLTLVRVDTHYEAVRHRHNFDQVRVMLEGRFGFGPGAEQRAGSVGYFAEGTYYTQRGDGPSLTLLLQAGGAGGSGYMGFDRLQSGIAELRDRGQFHDGVFTHVDAHGVKRNQDGYEAVWEHVNGRSIRYPAPRYAAPVILFPQRFEWLPVAACRGVAWRPLGCFNERGLGLCQWRLDANARLALPPASRRELMFVDSGSIVCTGAALPPRSALEVLPGEALTLRAGSGGAVLFGFSLPTFG
jgi:hypothetical protein